ncbi:MAG TPA: response regulator [Nitrososphaera sp.]|jgi:DNA-binding NtrC family response regulator|nr:response regulator [Nitrososphaera sp.]
MSKNRKVMVIDDEYDIVYVLRKHLEKWGFTVDTFTNPLHAFEIFKQNPDRYSIILTDIRMPEISGIALANMILKIKPGMPIVIMTAFEIYAYDLRVSLPKIKAGDVLRKPLTPAQVCSAVKKHLQTA